jgi:TRAP-type C4-dicarboxylate transport system permease small subunit
MSHGLDLEDLGVAEAVSTHRPVPGADHPLLAPIAHTLDALNRIIVLLGSIALVLASLILCHSVVVRYFLGLPTYWQDEMSVFLLVGAVFMSAAHVQTRRGHVAIEALAALLPASINKARLVVVDAASFVFCGFFAWKSWTLFHEAWVDGQVTSSTWGPPLWIPYSLMAVGMTLLTIQILLQIAEALLSGHHPLEDRT